jgi:serine/threonine protein kinase
VADFGFAKGMERSITEKTAGLTPAYAPPEFFHGEVHDQSDQYSLAVSYCQLRGGRLPVTGSPFQMMAQHTNGTPDLTMLPPSEREVVAKALAKRRGERWPS